MGWDWEDREPKNRGMSEQEYFRQLAIHEGELEKEEVEKRQQQWEEERRKRMEEQLRNQKPEPPVEESRQEVGDLIWDEEKECYFRIKQFVWDEEHETMVPLLEEVEEIE